MIIARCVKEAIYVNDDIVVTVLSISKVCVKLSISAPADTLIVRSELYEQNRFEKAPLTRKREGQ